MTNTKIINESAPRPQFRVRINVGVAYGTDVDRVEEILLSVARSNNMVVAGLVANQICNQEHVDKWVGRYNGMADLVQSQ
jgi:hypothetical protein